MGLVGIVLAAGAGTRAGGPKALRATDGEPWLVRADRVLRSAGCDPVLVVLGAAADEARSMLPERAVHVVAEDWEEGLSASLRAGLAAAEQTAADAALVTLVDLPGLPPAVARRVLGTGWDGSTVRRCVVHGVPSHPVLLGREHWAAVAAQTRGDRGAGPYLTAHGADGVECGDLWDGQDVDHA